MWDVINKHLFKYSTKLHLVQKVKNAIAIIHGCIYLDCKMSMNT